MAIRFIVEVAWVLLYYQHVHQIPPRNWKTLVLTSLFTTLPRLGENYKGWA